MNKGLYDYNELSNLLFSKSNDIISNANNFIQKYQNNREEENGKTELKRKNKHNYEAITKTIKDIPSAMTVLDEAVENKRNKENKESNISKEKLPTEKKTQGTRNNTPSCVSKNNSFLSPEQSRGLKNKDFGNKTPSEDELLERVDKLLISNGCLDRTNKELVLHLKHLEEEIEFIKKK